MKRKKITFYLLAVLLGGCLPSLHQLYTDETLIFNERLVGKWVHEDDIWEFRKAGEKKYQMRLLDDKAKEGRFEAHLVKLEGMMFLDIFPDTNALDDMQDFYKIHILPAHTFMKVDQIDPNLHLRMMNAEGMSDILKADPNVLKHEQIDDSIVLTASTEQLQKFIVAYANVTDIFGEPMEMKRLAPIYTNDALIFDANLIGQWEGKKGEMLDSAKMPGKTYDLTYVDADGKEIQCYANLAKVKDITLLAVFLDKSRLDPGDPNAYPFHLVPDVFLKVKRTEPELILQHLDHQEVLELLQTDSASQKQNVANPEYFFEGIRTEF